MCVRAVVLPSMLLVAVFTLSAALSQGMTPSWASVRAFEAASPTPTDLPLPGTPTILFQVTSQGWPQAINDWEPDHIRSWTVQNGALTSNGKGSELREISIEHTHEHSIDPLAVKEGPFPERPFYFESVLFIGSDGARIRDMGRERNAV
jgi:hypothetical protein